MSKYKLEFELKQHTPLIHFQGKQHGATLRATELKPKLDRFIITQLGDGDYEAGKVEVKNRGWLVGKGDHPALDYKVRIVNSGAIKRELPNRNLFFANSDKEEEDKIISVFATNIKVIIFVTNKNLRVAINNYFDDFLFITNFGARSTKGYGSFTHIENNITTRLRKYHSHVFRFKHVGNDWQQAVDTFHRKIKAGLNPVANRDVPYKSFLFKYLCETHSLRWEKRKIKQEFPGVIGANDKQPNDCPQISDDKFRYARAMLGVAGINEYDRGNKTVTIEHETTKRFASPIMYKIIERDVYILFDDSYKEIMDETFTFTYNRESFTIQTPSEDEFDLYGFLKYIEQHETLIEEVTS